MIGNNQLARYTWLELHLKLYRGKILKTSKTFMTCSIFSNLKHWSRNKHRRHRNICWTPLVLWA